MSTLDVNVTVGQLVAERPRAARTLERLGIDYCCGGRRPLAEACAERGLEARAVLDAVAADENAGNGEERNWAEAALDELCDHIEATHHAFLREELPRLSALIAKVASVHGEREPDLQTLAGVFRDFCMELESHMAKEEQVLFPIIRQLEYASSLPRFHCGSVNNPIRVMEFEHDSAGTALARMRGLTRDYTPTPEACNSYRAMLDGLAVLEKDMHQHIHKENNILFPRASALEARLARQA
ncbi:MAG TPA: iron-sulfur cluster repair di-iron protein [Phycisphaerae bacterium]|jgi:regulator of cell morphogenesis and NO signaling|nr:iron-sulfur cluster repair di-iron protein [Phycisphaerae bacterium]HOB73027.1 iron-sulfur cluster repair di-iron protein [Phycisphaerae bacterium]HOJ52924.1 iron-sulfur cluster repair di-iron protein [Phycisphaerae bacterium]HOL24660.1 iron-sulfur cluster repair di-iron protein [Phycisphaerae bacterium]HPP19197.1 iron-sulfur cluster repair di-iron protein [Phycisphaerae bacterium]